jgi:hypothetical protein
MQDTGATPSAAPVPERVPNGCGVAVHRDKARHGRKQPETIGVLAALVNVAGVLTSSS